MEIHYLLITQVENVTQVEGCIDLDEAIRILMEKKLQLIQQNGDHKEHVPGK